jgi:hypothetical protein
MTRRQPLLLLLVAAYVLAVAGMVAFLGTRDAVPGLLAAMGMLAIVMTLATPYTATVVVCAAGALAADYFTGRVPGFPLSVSGPIVVSLLLFLCGLAALLRQESHFTLDRFTIVPLLAAGFWLADNLLSSWGLLPNPVASAWAAAFPSSVLIVGVIALASSDRGRASLLWGFFTAGVTASTLAFAEIALGRNFFVELGIRVGPAARQWQFPLTRLGLLRTSGAFDSPILLGSLLGLTTLATLELYRSHRLGYVPTVLCVVVQFAALLTTVSRGPIIATVLVISLWTLSVRDLRTTARTMILAVVFVASLLAMWQIGLQGGPGGLISSPQSGLGANTQFREVLTRQVISKASAATLFGTPPQDNPSDLFTGFQSLDSQPANLLDRWGLFGAAVFAVLLFGPAVAVSRRPIKSRGARSFAYLVPIYIALVGTTVAFFGLFVPFVFAAMALTWTMPWDGERALLQTTAPAWELPNPGQLAGRRGAARRGGPLSS